MSQLDLARLQFAMTSIYHFLFVPVTIGLAFLTAVLQTCWHRSGRDEYLRLTRFFGTLLVINVAVGVVTGLVQEFQFGMDWSTYSRTVGDVFGAPAGDGGARRLLPRVDVPRAVALRLGQAVPPRAPGRHLGGGPGRRAVGGVHHGGELVDAAPGRLHDEPDHGQTAAQQHLGRDDEPGLPARLPARPARLADHGVGRHARRRGLAAAPGLCPRRLPPGGPARPRGPHPERLPGHDRRQRAGRDRGDVPADEDRGVRGAVGDLPAVLVLAVPDRRRQRRPHADQDHPDPAPAVAAGDEHVERPGVGPQPGPGAVRAASTGRATTCRTCSSSTGRCG